MKAETSTTAGSRSLLQVLGVRPRDLVAFVGGGGKTAALQLSVGEAAAREPARPLLATTTTAMFLAQLEALGHVVVRPEKLALMGELVEALAGGGPVGAARSVDRHGKVAGLPVEWVDELWFAGIADSFFVEADGSRGMSLKAFGPHEPQVPPTATIIVQVAGLDALGPPLTEPPVHRARLLAASLGVPLGSPVTLDLFADALREQLRVLSRRWPRARLVTLLNKAEDAGARAAGMELADRLLESLHGGEDHPNPDAVVVGSLREREFVRVTRKGASVSAVVLAAGRATRMGRQKVLLHLGDRSLVQRVVDAALEAKVAETIVVVGYEARAVGESLRDRPVRIAINPDYELGMSTSLHAGIRAVSPGCDAVVFLLGDQPLVSAEVIDLLVHRFVQTGALIVRPLVDGRPCHPVLMSSSLFPEILEQRGDLGGREIAQRHLERQELVPLDAPWLQLDIDTPEEYEAAVNADGQSSRPPR
jgi:molybdenum cofactor cytidylyltransferase